jgi:predicted nucleotidyltransferase
MKNARQSAKAFLSQLKHAGIPITNAYLFGSYAKGTATKDSDIDICLLSPAFGKDPIAEMVKLRMIAFPIDSRIEPIPFHTDDWNDTYSPLLSEIRKFGKHIV